MSDSLLEEFSFLNFIDEDEEKIEKQIDDLKNQYIINKQYEKDSLDLIKEFNIATSDENNTLGGISYSKISHNVEQIETDVMPWIHNVIHLDNNLFIDISKDFSDYFEIPKYIEEIGERKQYDIKINRIKYLVIGENVAVINSCSLSALGSLERLTLKKNSQLMVLYREAFAYMNKLKKIDLTNAENLTELPADLFRLTPIRHIKLNGNIEKIHYTNILLPELRDICIIHKGISEETGALCNKVYRYKVTDLVDCETDKEGYIWFNKGVTISPPDISSECYVGVENLENDKAVEEKCNTIGDKIGDTLKIDSDENSVEDDYAGWNW